MSTSSNETSSAGVTPWENPAGVTEMLKNTDGTESLVFDDDEKSTSVLIKITNGKVTKFLADWAVDTSRMSPAARALYERALKWV